MSTVDWAMLPRHPLATLGSAGRGARALLMAFGLLLTSGCDLVLFGGPPPWPLTRHPVGHLLGFVLALVVLILLLAVIDDLVLWIAERVRHHAHPPGWRPRTQNSEGPTPRE